MSTRPADPAAPESPPASGNATRPGDGAAQPPAATRPPKCLRCGRNEPMDDDGFCEQCLKAIDQACL